ncbi:antiviral reverse transcriptase Drt2 [Sphingobacterium hotanense]|uniref:antiviral reverse transcriptase Drt2 n=1 Tax=Sphingobacterium hotanense TaxID=649196 RepID=UPI0021A8FC8A|nr:antiviral reverse transcriptase Drt2 [Sphingobacterium hotanense]MCT1525653.1 reverse transcriptase domain-containing protein [Sphingobacterium hotanense]
MVNAQLYSADVWKRFVEKTLKSKEKRYKHFDHRFDFSKHNEKIRDLVRDPKLKRISTHAFLPFVKILIKTPRYKYNETASEYALETKIRPISYASHFDSYIYSFFAFALNERYQSYIHRKGFESCVLAYRSDMEGECNIQFAKKAFDSIDSMMKKEGECTAIALDIKGYFDNIDHSILKEKWCKVISVQHLPIDQYNLFKSLTQYAYVNQASLLKHFKVDLNKVKQYRTLLDLIPDAIDRKSFREKFELLRKKKLVTSNRPKTDKVSHKLKFKGIPQGSPMSSILSNIYLIDFDEWLYNRGDEVGFKYFRYCDDLLIVCKTKDTDKIISDLKNELSKKYDLPIQDKKTEIILFKSNKNKVIHGFNQKKTNLHSSTQPEDRLYKNLQYLGFEYNGRNVYIRPGSLSRYFRKMKGRIKKTMMMAYGKKSQENYLRKRQLYERYSHFGERNFITYAQNAARETYRNSNGVLKQGFNSVSIKRQLAAHFAILQKDLKESSAQFASAKGTATKS